MKSPERPPDEQRRLETLREAGVLDTPAEERFDRVTRLASRLFDVPIALVSLVDENRQWFKSRQGLDATETPREISFCGHAILEDGMLLVPDAALDARFRDNPLVTGEPWIRFYAGYPLQASNGAKLGTLCLIDREPRVFGDADVSLLRDLAGMVEQELAALKLATMDELTALSNRRGFEALARHALDMCRRLGCPASLLFFDLDGFKEINDRFGHTEGDRALERFAELMRQVFRESDVVARIGGDEFVVLLTNTSDLAVDSSLVRLRAAVDAHNRKAAPGYAIDFSVGVVAYDRAQHSGPDGLLREADRLMYEQKRRRRSAA